MSLGANAQTPPSTAEHESAKNYVPGLEQFMGVIQNEHAKLWYAGQARNWELAAYQLGEIKEVMSDVQDLVPTFKNLPLAQMLDSVITGPSCTIGEISRRKGLRKVFRRVSRPHAGMQFVSPGGGCWLHSYPPADRFGISQPEFCAAEVSIRFVADR